MIDQGLVRRFRQEVADQLSAQRTGADSAGRDPLAAADLRQLATELLARALERHAQERFAAGQSALEAAEEDQIVAAVLALLFGLGRLQPFLDNPDIENINANWR
jgi:pilus assembly protein CpaF